MSDGGSLDVSFYRTFSFVLLNSGGLCSFVPLAFVQWLPWSLLVLLSLKIGATMPMSILHTIVSSKLSSEMTSTRTMAI